MSIRLPPVTEKTIVVIVPTYDEGPVLQKVAGELLQKGYRIVIVDDGSPIPVKRPAGVFLIRHRVNLGQGAALQTGFEFAKKLQPDIIITFDADGQHEVDDIPSLMDPILRNEADLVLGSRFLPESSSPVPFSKKMVLHIARFLNFLLSGFMLSDAHNGLRALNKTALDKINITENRMAHATEILFEIKKHGLQFKEVAVHIHYSDYSKQKGQSVIDSIKILFDLVLHKLFK